MEHLLLTHSILRYIIIALGIWVLISSAKGTFTNSVFNNNTKLAARYLVISCHIMLIIGLVQYFLGPNGYQLFKTNPTSVVMKDATLRYFAVEHIAANIIGIIFITLASSLSKRATTDKSKYSKLFYFTLIGFILILSRIPWPNTAIGAGRGWL
jgi:hypothetical protein